MMGHVQDLRLIIESTAPSKESKLNEENGCLFFLVNRIIVKKNDLIA